MFKKSHYIALGVVTLLALVLLNLPSRATNRLKLAIGGLFLPLIGVKSAASESLAGGAGQSDLNQRFALQKQELEALRRENNQLRTQLGWQLQVPWKMKLAKVVVRDPANWWRTVQINLGSRDGIRENMTVLTPDGLAGRIGAVGYTASSVVLVGDPNCRVSALVPEAREMGVISRWDRSLLELDFVPRTSNLKPGQSVVTSGIGGLFPKGIKIGTVADAGPVEYGLFVQAHVKLAANLDALEEVWVLVQ